MLSFSGKKVLVTGGSRGIGGAIAGKFKDLGADVYISAAKSYSEKFDMDRQFLADFKDKVQIADFLEKIQHIPFDVLINNAGINVINPIEKIVEKDWADVIQVNLTVPMLIIKTLAQGMKQRGYGRIVNVTSIFSEVSKSQRATYSSSKYGLAGLTKAVALDLSQSNILVNSVAPGFIDTELTRTILSESQINELISQVPMGRLGFPEEVAELVCFLSSSNNSFMTGQNIVIDGGFTSV